MSRMRFGPAAPERRVQGRTTRATHQKQVPDNLVWVGAMDQLRVRLLCTPCFRAAALPDAHCLSSCLQ